MVAPQRCSVYDDFSAPSPTRNFELVVDGRSLFVNAGWLAELSPNFAQMAYGDASVSRAEVTDLDIKYEHVLEMMRALFFCPSRKPISEPNVTVLIQMACHFDVSSLLEECQEFVRKNIDKMHNQRLFQITSALAQCDRHGPTMRALVVRLSNLRRSDLSTIQFRQIPGDIAADVFDLHMRKRGKYRCNLM